MLFRSLKNVIERAVYRWPDEGRPIDVIEFDPFASPWRPASATTANAGAAHVESASVLPTAPASAGVTAVTDLRASVDAHERAILETTLAKCRFNQREAARALALSYDQLRHCLRKHGMLEKKAA